MRSFTTLFIVALASLAATPVFAQQGASLGGYGELHYNDLVDDDAAGVLDFHRFVLFAGYDFNEWVSFRSELEVEHTLVEVEAERENGLLDVEETGEVALEQAYLNLEYRPYLGVRAGLMLVPVGIVNPVHEPPTFHGVERPSVETLLIPSTWRESGIGIYGNLRNGLSYKAYLMAGLDPSGVTAEEAIRGARQSGFESSTANLALTARADYLVNLNLSVGGAYYFSQLDASGFHLAEAHALYERAGLEARGLLVFSTISDVAALARTYQTTPGKSQLGGYVEVAYDVLTQLAPHSEQQLSPFVRFEPYDTVFRTGGLGGDDPSFARRETTIGLTYQPAPQVALKADYQFLYSEGEEDLQQFNLGIGYNF